LFNQRGEVIGVCIAADPRDQRGLYAGLAPIHTILARAGLSDLFRRNAAEPESPPAVVRATSPEDPASGPSGRAGSSSSLVAAHDRGRAREEQRDPQTAHLGPVTGRLDPSQRREQPGLDQPSAQVEPDGRLRGMSGDQAPSARVAEDRSVPGRGAGRSEPNRAAAARRNASELRQEAAAVAELFQKAGEAEVVCIIRPLNSPRAASRVVIINRASPKFVADLVGEIQTQTVSTSLRRSSVDQVAGGNAIGRENVRFQRRAALSSVSLTHDAGQTPTSTASLRPYRRRIR